MAAKVRLTPFAKLLITAVVVAAAFIGITTLKKNPNIMNAIAPKKGGSEKSIGNSKDVIKVCVVTWGGYAGGQYFNNGFKASKESQFYKDYGILVEFKVIDDFNASRAAWKAGEVDLLWITADAFPTEAGNLKEFSPKILFQSDWSRGGDAIVVRPGISSVNDLRGKKVAVAFGTPSHTFLLWMLKAGNLTTKDLEVVEVPSAIDAAAMFKSGRVDGAVVWSPDDEDCVKSVNGARVLKSTKEATNIIADVFYAKEEYINANRDKLTKFIEGWMKGAAEINSSADAKAKAAKILAEGLNMDEGFCQKAIENVRLCTYGDNLNFFGLNSSFTGVTGENLYNTMSDAYTTEGLITGTAPAWRTITDPSLLRSLQLTGTEHDAEAAASFAAPTAEDKTAEAFATKSITINFDVASSDLNQTTQYIIDQEVAKTLQAFGNVRVRIEGNTDNTGLRETNIALSRDRAQAVANYLVEQYKFDRNRFVIVGNGPDKPSADNSTAGGRSKNRRTDIMLLESK